MIQAVRIQLADLGKVLDCKQDECIQMFDANELQTFFRAKDNVRMLLSALADLERAMYRNKILL